MVAAITALGAILGELKTLAAAAGSAPTAASGGETASAGSVDQPFSTFLNAAVGRLDGAVAAAGATAKAAASDDPEIALSDVMVSLEQANLALQLAANVRDKVTSAYANIMNMPV
jgi:flagellar hook-basal body complex protein FliE